MGNGLDNDQSGSNYMGKVNEISVKNAFFLSFSAHESGGSDFTLSSHSQIISDKSKEIQSKMLFFYPSAP